MDTIDRKHQIGAERKQARRLDERLDQPQGRSQPAPWEIDTPTSRHRLAQARQDVQEAQEKVTRDAQGRHSNRLGNPNPDRPLTPQELANVAELYRAGQVRTPAEQRDWKRRTTYPTGTLYEDQRDGERCSCGSPWPCPVHLFRRHQRPYVRAK